MSRSLAIRTRLTFWYAAVLAAMLALLSLLVWFSMRHQLISQMEHEVADRADRLQSFISVESTETPRVDLTDELGEFAQGVPSDTWMLLVSSPDFRFQFPRDGRPVDRSGWLYQKRTFRAGAHDFELLVGASLAQVHQTLNTLAWLLLALTPLVTAIAVAGGALLSRRALTPLSEIATSASAIAIDNLSTRLPAQSTGDELEQMTTAWNTMLDRLESAVTTLSQFAADASHELRTPLSIIRTSAELALRRARSPESYQHSLREIVEEADRMTRLVEDLLFLARHNETDDSTHTTVDLSGLIQSVITEMSGVATARGIALHLTEAPAWVAGSQPALRRLFVVLLDNAIKYSPDNARVDVAICAGHPHHRISIADHGCGIPAQALPHIFQRFYQADASRSDRGFGLGLSLADTIARSHHAHIEVDSQPGAGSTFTVVLPALAAPAQELRQTA